MARTDARGGPQTRARIREVANQLFIDRGFDAVTVAEIAREAGVSSVTVFNHFPTKEDLFLDRAADAVALLEGALQQPHSSAVSALRDLTLGLIDRREPLSGVDPRSMPFFRTVAGSPALVARARQIAAELEASLAGALRRDPSFEGDADLLSSLFIAGYATVLVQSAARMIAGTSVDELIPDHRARFELLFSVLSGGFGA